MLNKGRDQGMSKILASFDFLVIAILAVSFCSIVLLVFDSFTPRIVVFGGVFLAVTVYLYFIDCLSFSFLHYDTKTLLVLLAILFLSLIFRTAPFPWVHGGQDQGVYVNMSSYFQHGGKIFIEDNVINTLPSEKLVKIYKENLRPGAFQPGVFYGGEKDYVFQFYHLHPLWMGIFGDFFGDMGRVYSLTFFSLLSIIGLFLLTFELSGSRLAAGSVGVLIALNPLHAFFSKWPVTEVVALAFSSLSLYYLARYLKLFFEKGRSNRILVVIAALCMSALFFVRISGFFYVPFFLILFIIGLFLAYSKKNAAGYGLMLFSGICLILYATSVYYGLVFSPNYSNSIYRVTFGKFLGENWKYIVFIGASTIISAVLVVWFFAHKGRLPKAVWRIVNPTLWSYFCLAIMFIAAVISLAKVYLLGFTDYYARHPWWDLLWGLSGGGYQVVISSGLLNAVVYSSPFLLFLLFASFREQAKKAHFSLLLIFITVPFFANIVLNQFVLPYQYYYARYLLSEIVPYAIVLMVLSFALSKNRKLKWIGFLAVLATIPLFVYFSAKQLGAEQGVRPYKIIKSIASTVDGNDILLFNREGWHISSEAIKTPLVFYFGKKVYSYTNKSQEDIFKGFTGYQSPRVWVLSPKIITDDRLEYYNQYLHYDTVMEGSGSIPVTLKHRFGLQTMYLYRLVQIGKNSLYWRGNQKLAGSRVGTHTGSGMQTDGRAGYLMFGPYQKIKSGSYTLSVTGKINANSEKVVVDVVGDQGKQTFARFAGLGLPENSNADDDVLLEEKVTLNETVDDLEVRIWVDDKVNIFIDGYNLLPVAVPEK